MIVNKILLKRLGLEDYREFAEALGHWAYTTDFTYNERAYTTSFDRLVQAFVKESLEE